MIDVIDIFIDFFIDIYIDIFIESYHDRVNLDYVHSDSGWIDE